MKEHQQTTKHMRKFFLILAGLSVLGLTACKKDGPVTTGTDELDKELTALLEMASNGEGKAFFTMPDATDFDKIPQDPNNPLTTEKVNLGKLLYHETALSINAKTDLMIGTYSCATCHFAQGGFAACKPQGIGDGGMGFGDSGESREKSPIASVEDIDVQTIKTPSSMNDAYQTVTLWSGALGGVDVNIGTEANWTVGSPKENNNMGFHGLETQAIAGLKVHRLGIDPTFIDTTEYKELFDAAFPSVDISERYTRKYAGLAIAAYERTLLSNQAPFQKWLKDDAQAMSKVEKEGAILFFGKAGCVECHTGPALNSMTFYGLGMNDLYMIPGVFLADAQSVTNLGRGGFTQRTEDMFKFKTPQLYNLEDSPHYGHGSSFNTIREVVEYKNIGLPQNEHVIPAQLASAFKSLELSTLEITQLTEFLKKALKDDDLIRYTPSQLPSGNCFPNNDPLSKLEMGCD